MLEGALAATWPVSPNPAAVLQLDEPQREAAQLVADSALPAGADTLAWRAPIERSPTDSEAEASGTALPENGIAGRRVRACAARHLPLVWR